MQSALVVEVMDGAGVDVLIVAPSQLDDVTCLKGNEETPAKPEPLSFPEHF